MEAETQQLSLRKFENLCRLVLLGARATFPESLTIQHSFLFAACASAIAEQDPPPGAGADEATSDKKLDISAMQ